MKSTMFVPHAIFAVACCAALLGGCKKTTTSQTKDTDAASIFCSASGAWFTALGLGGTGPMTTVAVGVAFSAANGALERSSVCTGTQDRQYTINDIALLSRDELVNSHMQELLMNLNFVKDYLDSDYNEASIGGDDRRMITDSLMPKITQAIAEFNDKGLAYGGAWAMATGLRMQLFNLILARDDVSGATPAQIRAAKAKDAADALVVANGIEGMVGKLQKAADAAAGKFYETDIHPNSVSDPNYSFRDRWCRRPTALTPEQQSYADSFYSQASVPGTIQAQKKVVSDGPVCVSHVAPLGCNGACADEVNAAVNAKIAEVATKMKDDLIDHERHMHLLRDTAAAYRQRMQKVIDAAKVPTSVSGSSDEPANAAARAPSATGGGH